MAEYAFCGLLGFIFAFGVEFIFNFMRYVFWVGVDGMNPHDFQEITFWDLMCVGIFSSFFTALMIYLRV